ncbi:2-C-methyl-D-erythritol 2,4-cyclodiphosphate synthase [Thermostilla marina]
MSQTVEFRIGLGTDLHRLEPDRPLRLGGVIIPSDLGAVGHSDADALLHAVTDAVLGAASLGDIGTLFPDSAPENRNRDSGDMLRTAWQLVRNAGWELVNLDCVVHLQRPKLANYRTAIQQAVGTILGVPPERIGVKAKTGEGLDAVGNRRAVAVQCVALLQRSTN